jgi:hypothetical protein
MVLFKVSRSIHLIRVLTAMAWAIVLAASPAQGEFPLPVPKPGLVIVQVVDGDAEGDEHLVPGMKVFVDYVPVTVTDRKFRAKLWLPPGRHLISVVEPRVRAGGEEVEVRPGETTKVSIRIKEAAHIASAFPYQLQIDQGPIVRSDIKVLIGAFTDEQDRVIRIKDLKLEAGAVNGGVDLSPLLEVLPDGRFRSRADADLAPFLALDGPVSLRHEATVLVRGPNGATVEAGYDLGSADGEDFIAIGRYSVKGRLVPPPERPTMPVAGIALTATYETDRDEIRKSVELATDASGSFEVTHVPLGKLKIEAKDLFFEGMAFGAGGTIEVDSDKVALIRIGAGGVFDDGDTPAIEILPPPP